MTGVQTCALPIWFLNKSDSLEYEVVKRSIEIFQSPAGKYLMLGKMIHPLKIDVPLETAEFSIWDRRGENIKKVKKMKFPAILHNVFESSEKTGIGAVFFNWTEEVQKVELSLALFPLPKGSYDVWKYGKDGNSKKPFLSKTSLKKTIPIELGYGESVFIEVIPARERSKRAVIGRQL